MIRHGLVKPQRDPGRAAIFEEIDHKRELDKVSRRTDIKIDRHTLIPDP